MPIRVAQRSPDGIHAARSALGLEISRGSARIHAPISSFGAAMTASAEPGYVGHTPAVSVTDLPPDQPVAPVNTVIAPPTGNLGAAPGKPGGQVEVAPRLFLGNWEDAQSWEGETLNLRDGHSYAKQTFHVEMLVGTVPSCFYVSRKKLDEAADIIEERLRLGDRSLLVHCLEGKERAPLAIAWWMVKTGKQPDLKRAIAQLQSARAIVEDRSDWIEPEPPKPVDMRIEIPSGSDAFEAPPSAPVSSPTDPPAEAVPTPAPSGLSEREKYRRMWEHAEYRAVAPGESIASQFMEIVKPKPGATVIDFGAGTGRGAVMLALLGGLKVKMLDFGPDCLDDFVREALVTQAHALTFHEQDLTQPIGIREQYGYCTDVMEHIPPEQVDLVLWNILHAAQHVFLQIACTDDVCGALIGEPLHLSVHPFAWWLAKLKEFDAVIHWSKDCGTHCLFYVSAWTTGQQVLDTGVLNVEHEQMRANVRANITREPRALQVMPYLPNDEEVLIVGGGPSLAGQLETIRYYREGGAKLVTLNGAYNWCLEQGLRVSATVVCDARPFNRRFVDPVVPDCKYFIASQCDPSLFEALPHERTYMWHSASEVIKDLLNEHLGDAWYEIPGGQTVLLRSFVLLRMLGFSKFRLFGCDSCLSEDRAHHAYAQPENDSEMVVPAICGGKIFPCHAWMFAQAQGFIDLIAAFGDFFEIAVHGGGLLDHILKTGASLSQADAPPSDKTLALS